MFDRIIETNSKRISIQITNRGEVILKKPKNYDIDLLNKFINSKSHWIENNRNKMLENIDKNKNIINLNSVLISGNEVKLILNADENKIYADCIKAKNEKSLILLLKKYANEIIQNKTKELSKRVGVQPEKASIENAKRRWGVCTSKKEIKINFRAIMLNDNCLNYIIIHELLHLKEFNHSTKFWNLVKKYVPNYVQIKKHLKDFAFLLELYR